MTFTHAQLALAVSFLVGLAAAQAGSLLTKLAAPQWVKSAVTWFLGVLAGVLPTVTWAPNAPWTQYVEAVGLALAAQVISHYTGLTNLIAVKTARFGLSGPKPAPAPAVKARKTAR